MAFLNATFIMNIFMGWFCKGNYATLKNTLNTLLCFFFFFGQLELFLFKNNLSPNEYAILSIIKNNEQAPKNVHFVSQSLKNKYVIQWWKYDLIFCLLSEIEKDSLVIKGSTSGIPYGNISPNIFASIYHSVITDILHSSTKWRRWLYPVWQERL